MQDKLRKNYEDVRNRIDSAALRVERDPDEIKLIAVSKNHSVEKINFFRSEGIDFFGENRVQELREKNDKFPGEIDWHFIGHLQTNKVKYLLRMNNLKMIHGVESIHLAREINKRAKRNERIMPVLVEINISADPNKYGISPENLIDFLSEINNLSNINICGLMTIIPYLDDPEEGRRFFREMALLKDRAIEAGFNLTELSMGMSNDYEIAIEEGATMVRIGTALFGEREY